MKRSLIAIMISLQAVLVFSPAPSFCGQGMGLSSGHDLDALWAGAREAFDLSKNDAVFLLDSRRVTLLENGGRRTAVHTVVWIGEEPGISGYADLRIPWNSAFSTLEVTVLRTWRDGRWWPDGKKVSGTAVVETLPFAIASADDYSSMRETMLLHDGVALPCIMETEYVIEEKPGSAGGWDGSRALAVREPSMLCEYVLEVPEATGLTFASGGGLGDPEISAAEGGKKRLYRWKVERSPGTGFPADEASAVRAPRVSWSTWKDWESPARFVSAIFDEAAVLGSDLADSVAARLRGERSSAARAGRIAEMVGEYTRQVGYDSRFWTFSPRPAVRTYETAYGHALDRAVLAAAMFREAGFDAQPVYRCADAAQDPMMPGFATFEEVGLCVTGDMFHAYYDPSESSLEDAPGVLFGGMVWKPSEGKEPAPRPAAEAAGDSGFELILAIEPCAEGAWKGSGYYRAEGIFAARNRMTGEAGKAAAHLESVAGSVLSGVSVTGCDAQVLEKTRVDAGFEFTYAVGEKDEAGRTVIEIGDPDGAALSRLPADIHPFLEKRTSHSFIKGKMTQRVSVRLRTDGKKISYVPRGRSIENEAGSFSLEVEMADGWLTVDRILVLSGGTVAPESWPALRALLLEEKAAENRTIMLE